MYKKILLPLDGSPFSEHVVPYVGQLAGGLAAEVTLFHVSFPESARITSPLPSETYFGEVREALAEQGVTKVTRRFASGVPAEEITRFAEDMGYDLIAMTTHGRSGLGRWVLGSTADRVLQTTALPLLLGRPGVKPSATRPISRLVVPLDGSPLAEAASPVAQALAAKMRLPVSLIRVVPPFSALYDSYAAHAYDPALDTEMEEAARDYLTGARARLSASGITTESRVRRGTPAEEILDDAEGEAGGLIVMSSHGRGGPARWVMGSVSDRVVRGAKAPVLLLRAPAAALKKSAAA